MRELNPQYNEDLRCTEFVFEKDDGEILLIPTISKEWKKIVTDIRASIKRLNSYDK